MKTRISKAYRSEKHVGWKKTVGGRECFLAYGTTPAVEAKALILAEVLEAKWSLAKCAGQTELSESDFEEAKAFVEGRPKWSTTQVADMALRPEPMALAAPAVSPMFQESRHAASVSVMASAPATSRRWLHASVNEFVSTTRRALKSDGSNGDHIFTLIQNIQRALEAQPDLPLDQIRRKELDDWLLAMRNMKSKTTGKPLAAATVRNLASAIRAAMIKFAEWEWWFPPALWERAFKGYSIKKLQTPSERKKRRKRPPMHSLDERRALWQLCVTIYEKSMMALAEWAGHTQKEIATLAFDEIKNEDGEMFIDRDRHKTGVHVRWWIPPEAAVFIRALIARTGDEIAAEAVLTYFGGKTVVQIEKGSYKEPAPIPKASSEVVNTAIGDAVAMGKVWLLSGPASLLAEPIPAGVLSASAKLRIPPATISAAAILPENLPTAWKDGTTNGLGIAASLSQNAGHALPWKVVRDVIAGALQARFIALTENSGTWPCDFSGAQAVRIKVPTAAAGTESGGAGGQKPGIPQPNVRVASGNFEPAQVQDLGDLIPRLLEMKAKAKVAIKFLIKLEVGDGKAPLPDSVVKDINAILKDVSEEFRLA